MSFHHNPRIILEGLEFVFDPANTKNIIDPSTYIDIANNYEGISPVLLTNNANYVSFDSSSYGIHFGDILEVSTGNYTLGCWVRVTSTLSGTYGGLIGKSYLAGTNGYGLYLINTNQFSIQTRRGATLRVVSSNTLWELDKWYNIVATREYGLMHKLYVNGKFDIMDDQIDNIDASPSSEAIFKIGSTVTDTYRFRNGDIGLCYKYNRVLTEEEILKNYDAFKSRYVST
jgi:hypothetical protein